MPDTMPVTNIVGRIVFGEYDLINDCTFEYDYKNDRILCVVNINNEQYGHLGQNLGTVSKFEKEPKTSGLPSNDEDGLFKKNTDYIIISELPQEEQEPFKKWLIVHSVPDIKSGWIGTAVSCVWVEDYESWKKEVQIINEDILFGNSMKNIKLI